VIKPVFFILSAMAMVACGANADSSNNDGPLGESQGKLLAGPRLSEGQIATLLRNAGFDEATVPKMVCTAKYESSFYERASHTNTNGTTDYGLFQINSIHLGSGGCAKTASAVYDPSANAHCAHVIYSEQGLNAWYGYKRHSTECNHYRVQGDPGPGATDSSGSSGSDSSSSDSSSSSSSDDTNTVDQSSSCWSATLEEEVPEGTCVNSAYDPGEFQCSHGAWYGGVKNGSGVDGACTAEY
jgi:lysozyme C